MQPQSRPRAQPRHAERACYEPRDSRVPHLLNYLVGPHFGLIEDLVRAPAEPDDPPLHVYAARIAEAGFPWPPRDPFAATATVAR